jgi:hypothetical protein
MANLAVLGRLQYDAHIRVINVDTEFTMDEVAQACAAPAVGYQAQHPNPDKPLRVRLTTKDDNAKPFPRDMKVKETSFKHFECLDVYVE